MLKENITKFKYAPISSITPFTLQDFPDFIASIFWFQGCNFCCKYCYNIDLVKGQMKNLPFDYIYRFLISRKNKLEGIVFSGGECTLYSKFIDLVKFVKNLGFFIKIDTNGSNPEILEKLLEYNLVKYIALDYKAPFKKYEKITNYSNSRNIERSLELLINSNINFEVRTTIHTNLIDEEDINLIIKDLDKRNYKGNFYIQNFKDGPTIGNLETPKTQLDISKLISSYNFNTKFRNFNY